MQSARSVDEYARCGSCGDVDTGRTHEVMMIWSSSCLRSVLFWHGDPCHRKPSSSKAAIRKLPSRRHLRLSQSTVAETYRAANRSLPRHYCAPEVPSRILLLFWQGWVTPATPRPFLRQGNEVLAIGRVITLQGLSYARSFCVPASIRWHGTRTPRSARPARRRPAQHPVPISTFATTSEQRHTSFWRASMRLTLC